MLFNRHKNAFSLPEALITLLIIGVVAGILLPFLRENYEKQRLAPALKGAYSVLKRGMEVSQVINEATETWNFNLNANDFYEEYVKSYYVEANRFTIADIKNRVTYYNMDGTLANEPAVSNDDSVVIELVDGAHIFISEEMNPKYKTVAIDINGLRRPNIIGKDLFIFAMQGRYGLTPYGYAVSGETPFGMIYDQDILMNSEPYGCAHSGVYCSAYIMSNNWNMTKNYPR